MTIPISRVIGNDNNRSKRIQQIWQFWKWHPAPAKAYRPLIKIALGRIEIFCHKWEIQRGQPEILQPIKWKKKLNSRTIPENKNFQVISSAQNNPEQFKEFTEFQNHWASWNSINGITCIDPVTCHPPTKGSFLSLYSE